MTVVPSTADVETAGRLDGGHEYIGKGRYFFRFERRNGEWRFLHRTVIVDTDRSDPVTKRWAPDALLRGTRDRSDPSY